MNAEMAREIIRSRNHADMSLVARGEREPDGRGVSTGGGVLGMGGSVILAYFIRIGEN